MSSLGSPSPFLFAGKKSHTVSRSLRFNSGDSASLTRTPSSTSNRRTYTFSFWTKAVNLGTSYLFEVGSASSNNNRLYIRFDSSAQLSVGEHSIYRLITTQKFRDPSAWYHIVFAVDTTLSTADNRNRFYVNGQEITSFSTRNNFSQNLETGVNRNNLHNWGRSNIDSHYANVYLSEINFIDGYQYDPSYFGETDTTTGQWIPKQYTGSYGTNGYYLKFADNSGTTATTLGKDSSGNGNNFTPNNFAVSDAVKDSPTNNFATFSPLFYFTNGVAFSEGNLKVTFGGSGNGFIPSTFALQSGKWYAELLPEYIGNGVGVGICGRNINVNDWSTGTDVLAVDNEGNVVTNSSNSYPSTPPSSSYSTGDVIGVALDITAGTVTFYKNNSQIYQTNLSNMSTGGNSDSIYFFCFADGSSATSARGIYNFGQDSSFAGNKTAQGNADGNGNGDFYYSPPSGHLAACSANLPDPTIKLPNKYFDTLLYSGNESGQSITGLNFAPDWVWIKKRNESASHCLFDSLRGATKRLKSDNTDTELTQTDSLTAFNSDGFTLGGNGHTSENGDTFVAWNWDAGETDSKTYTVTVVSDSGNKYRFDGFGTSAVTLDLAEGGTYTFNYPSAHPLRFSTTSDGTHGGGSEYTTGVSSYGNSVTITVAASAPTLYYYCTQHSGMGGQVNTNSTLGSSNFDGSNQTTVKTSLTSGFSIIKYTGTGSLNTIGHGLGVAPNVYIIKNRDASDNWIVYTTVIDGSLDFLYLNLSNSKTNSGNTAPTSSVIEISGATTNDSGNKHICYAFSEVAGYSKFGSYTGNGSSDGTFVFTGFRPAWIMIKKSSGSSRWQINDIKRNPENVTDALLFAEDNIAESASSSHNMDLLCNGFKHRNTEGELNGNGSTFIYLAFAESPFKYARAR